MQNAGAFKFAVVQFLQQPYPSIDEYICIPQSWIKERRVTDRRSLVAYPSEHPSLTKNRVEKADKVSDKWKLYMAIVKHETYSYEDACNYIVARTYDASIENRCLPTTGAGQTLLPSTTTGVNSSSLKRNKQPIDQQKRFKVVNDVKLTNRCRYSRKSSECSNNKLTTVTSGLSTDVSSEKLIEVMEGISSSTQKGSQQNSANNSSICSSSSPNTSQFLPANKCTQQDLRATELLGRSPPKVTVVSKSPSVKNNTVQHTLNSSNQPFQSFSHLQQNQLLQSDQDRLINPGPFTQNIAVDSITNTEDLWLDRMADIFDKMNSDFSHTCKMAHELHESLVQAAKSFQRIASLSANLRKSKKSKVTVETPEEVTVEVQKVAEKEQVVMGEKEKSDMAENKKEDNNAPKRSDDNHKSSNNDKSTVDDNDHDNDKGEDKNKRKKKNKNGNGDKDKDKNRDGRDKDEDKHKDEDANKDEEAPKKIRGCSRTFALPSEYNPKDTKWTLKYRKPDAKLGLIELVEKSRVYINAIRLANCKRVSRDSKTLARMLLVEIFSQNALSVCSLTGARANAFDINGTNVRPGLDEHARMVILSFVEEHARQKGWGSFDTQGVLNSIRSKIQEIRAKYG